MTRMTKSEWDEFVKDDEFWGDFYCEDTLFRVNSQEVDELDESLPGETVIHVLEGDIVDHNFNPVRKLKNQIKAWRMRKGTRAVVFRVPADLPDKEIRSVAKSLGWVMEK